MFYQRNAFENTRDSAIALAYSNVEGQTGTLFAVAFDQTSAERGVSIAHESGASEIALRCYGLYEVSYTAVVQGTGADSTGVWMFLELNGTLLIASQTAKEPVTANETFTLSQSTLIRADRNSTLRLYMQQDGHLKLVNAQITVIRK